MNEGLGFHEAGSLKKEPALDGVRLKGFFTYELIRDGKVIDTKTVQNTVVNEGRNKLLDVGFHGATQITQWYIGLIAGTSANAVSTDTMSSHSGWTEFVGYSESVRQDWTTSAPASQQITSSSSAVFSINATGNVQGFFVSSIATKSTTTGTLWSGLTFSNVPVVNGDQVKVTYTLTAN